MFRVLIVDDELLIRKRICLGFDWAELGFPSVDDEGDPFLALQKIETGEYDLAIVDIAMPGMNGIELVKRLRESGNRIRVIFLTGHSDFAYAKEAIRYGVSSYILKPVNEDEFIQTVSELRKELEKEQREEQLLESMTRHHTEVRLFQEFRFFSGLLSNGFLEDSQKEASEKASSMGVNVQDPYYLFVFHLSRLSETDEEALSTRYEKILEAGKRLLPGTGFSVIFHLLDNNLVFHIPAVFPGFTQLFGIPDTGALRSLGSRLLKELTPIFEEEAVCGISERADTFRALPDAYQEALEALKNAGLCQKQVMTLEQAPKDVPLVTAACEYLRAHSSDLQLTQAGAAEALGVTAAYLSAVFKKSMGVSMMNYLAAIRLDRARELLLREKELSIREIALQTGYSDEFYFSRSFKKHFGISPSRIRRELEEQ